MDQQEQKVPKQETQDQESKKSISRRDVIKAGGVLAVGLAYARPSVESVYAKQAFNDYGGDPGGGGGGTDPCEGKGKPSIEVTATCNPPGWEICNTGDAICDAMSSSLSYWIVDGKWQDAIGNLGSPDGSFTLDYKGSGDNCIFVEGSSGQALVAKQYQPGHPKDYTGDNLECGE